MEVRQEPNERTKRSGIVKEADSALKSKGSSVAGAGISGPGHVEKSRMYNAIETVHFHLTLDSKGWPRTASACLHHSEAVGVRICC